MFEITHPDCDCVIQVDCDCASPAARVAAANKALAEHECGADR